jgi:hypothetical protein
MLSFCVGRINKNINLKKYNMTNEQIKDHLLKAGVKNLKEFGYPDANKENILTDIIYGGMFKSMLNDNKGQATKQVDDVIDELLSVVKQNGA